VLEPADFVARLGGRVDLVPVDGNGRVEQSAVAEELTADTSLVSLMMVNNETGTIHPTEEIVRLVKARSSAIIHTDAVQALGKMPIDVKELGVDLLSLSAHKIHGPKGIGALYIKAGTELEPFIHGGSQERNRRGG